MSSFIWGIDWHSFMLDTEPRSSLVINNHNHDEDTADKVTADKYHILIDILQFSKRD